MINRYIALRHDSFRDFLLRSAVLSAALVLPVPRVWAQPRFAQNPFSLGVASGYPQPDSVVLWTRLAPDPLNGGGMPPAVVNVRWEIAADEHFQKIVDRGETAAVPALAHAVHVNAPQAPQGSEPPFLQTVHENNAGSDPHDLLKIMLSLTLGAMKKKSTPAPMALP